MEGTPVCADSNAHLTQSRFRSTSRPRGLGRTVMDLGRPISALRRPGPPCFGLSYPGFGADCVEGLGAGFDLSTTKKIPPKAPQT
jgi:hypothetical protein